MAGESQDEVQRRVGRVLADLRRERGIPQDQFGFMSQQHVSGIELGKRNPSWFSIVRMLATMDVSAQEFGRAWDERTAAESPAP